MKTGLVTASFGPLGSFLELDTLPWTFWVWASAAWALPCLCLVTLKPTTTDPKVRSTSNHSSHSPEAAHASRCSRFTPRIGDSSP